MGPSQVFRGQGGLANWRTGGITQPGVDHQGQRSVGRVF